MATLLFLEGSASHGVAWAVKGISPTLLAVYPGCQMGVELGLSAEGQVLFYISLSSRLPELCQHSEQTSEKNVPTRKDVLFTVLKTQSPIYAVLLCPHSVGQSKT